MDIKKALEDFVMNRINHYSMVAASVNASKSEKFFGDIERFVAGLFADGKIRNTYYVRSKNNGDLEVNFSPVSPSRVETRYPVTFMLPAYLKWNSETKNSPSIAITSERPRLPKEGDVRPGARINGYEIYSGDKWIQMWVELPVDPAGDVTVAAPAEQSLVSFSIDSTTRNVVEEKDPIAAYDKAMKYIVPMG